MPIFEYTCDACHHDFEALVRAGRAPECPNCHSTQLTKLLSVFATTAAAPERAPARPMAGPFGQCGHPDGPGSCTLH